MLMKFKLNSYFSQFKFILFTGVIFVTQFSSAQLVKANTQAAPAVKSVRVTNINAKEGTDSFILDVKLNTDSQDQQSSVSGEEDDYYGYRQNGPKIEIDPVGIYDFVKVTPQVGFSINSTRQGFTLVGDFKPESYYSVTINKGLKLKTGEVLHDAFVQNVYVGSYSPKIRFKSHARYVPQNYAGNIPFETVNVEKVKLTIRQIFSQNLHSWLFRDYSDNGNSEEIRNKVINVKAKKNTKYEGFVSLEDLAPLGQGVFELVIKNEGSDYTRDVMSVIVTNMSNIVKVSGKNQISVWAFSMKDLQPLGNVQVDLLAESNRKLASCQTLAQSGECQLAWKGFDKSIPFAVVFKNGKDISYVKLSELNLKNDRFHSGNKDYVGTEQGFEAYVYSGRNLYRPGEVAYFTAQIRNPKFESATKLPIIWKITNPKDKLIKEITAETDEVGNAHLVFPTQQSFETGKYQVEVWSGKKALSGMTFLVEEFVPERIGVKVNPKEEISIKKEGVEFKIQANYLFGPPVANGNFSSNCNLYPAFTSIPKNPDYVTGLYGSSMPKVINLESTNGQLDANGSGTLFCNYRSQLGNKFPVVYQLKAKVDVEEAGSSRVSTKTGSSYIASTDTLIGLKTKSKENRTIVVAGGLFDFNGAPKKANLNLKARLYKVESHWYYGEGGSYYNGWKVEEVIIPTGIEKTISVKDSQFEVSFNAPEGWGSWLVRVEDNSSGYTADINVGYLGWYYSGDSTGPSVKDPEDLKIQVSKKELSPGEKFKVMVVAPFAGKLLVGLETNKILDTKWVKVDKPGKVELEFETPKVYPNFYLTGILVKTPLEGKRFIPARAWGAESIKVIPSEHRLEVQAKTVEAMESRKDLVINITNSQKTAAVYTVAVVDEGILQMTQFKSPNPLNSFFESRKMGVTSIETMGWTMMSHSNKTTPGGDEGGVNKTNVMPVRLVSFYEPNIKSDSEGKATVKFPIPEFQGKVRVMVVASHKTKMGSSESFTTVRDPIVIQSTLPRFLTQGDSFKFPVNVTNASGKDQTIKLSVESGPDVLIAQNVQTVQLANNQSKVIKFATQVKGFLGYVPIKVMAVNADGKLSTTESFELKLRPQGIEQSMKLAFDTGKDIQLAKEIPANWRTDFLQLQASISNMPYLNQLAYVDDLLHYPYGCIEQTTSGTLPLLAMEDVLKFLDRKNGKEAPPIKNMVNSGISRVLSMQTSSGGFGYWPGDDQAIPWGTAYATFMLLEAKKLGFDVPQSALNASLNYLESWARNKKIQNVTNSYTDDNSYPFVLFVLAKGGKQVTTDLRRTLANFKEFKWTGVDGENAYLLAATAHLVGDKESLNKIMTDQSKYTVQLTGQKDHYHTYWSSVRSDALRLSIMEDLWPAHASIEMLSQRVASNIGKSQYYYSTQELGWSIFALGKRARNFAKIDKSEIKNLKFLVNGKESKVSYEVDGLPVWNMVGSQLINSKVSSTPVSSQKGAWLYVNLTGITKSVPKTNPGFFVRRRILDKGGLPVDPSKIKQGDTLVVELNIQKNQPHILQNMAIVDRLPAGFEIENSRLGRSDDSAWIKPETIMNIDYQDIRDDRIQLFGTLNSTNLNFYYTVRAVTPGTYIMPGTFIEQMYDPMNYYYSDDTNIQILEK